MNDSITTKYDRVWIWGCGQRSTPDLRKGMATLIGASGALVLLADTLLLEEMQSLSPDATFRKPPDWDGLLRWLAEA